MFGLIYRMQNYCVLLKILIFFFNILIIGIILLRNRTKQNQIAYLIAKQSVKVDKQSVY